MTFPEDKIAAPHIGDRDGAAQVLLTQAKELYEAGAAMMVLELMPSAVAAQVQQDNPGLITIGIGAGPQTAGQVMVTQDMLRITRGKLPRFVRDLMQGSASVGEAFARYVADVKSGAFPAPEHSY